MYVEYDKDEEDDENSDGDGSSLITRSGEWVGRGEDTGHDNGPYGCVTDLRTKCDLSSMIPGMSGNYCPLTRLENE